MARASFRPAEPSDSGSILNGPNDEAADSPAAHALVADLRAPEAQDAHHHVGAAEPASLHVSFPC